jgi:energy-coupling factor transport system ATP-binding protein
MQTPVLVLDEPTTGQDRAGVVRIQGLVSDVVAAGRTVIAVSHDLRFVAETFPRVVVLRAGRVVLDGSPADVFAAPNQETLASTGLEPPWAARVAGQLRLGPVATEAELVAAVAGSG